MQTDFFRARERNEANLGMSDDRVADLAARARNEVHDAGRNADFVQEVDEPGRHDRRVARGLEDDRIARDDCRGSHTGHDRSGEVPRRNDRADAERDVDHLVSFAFDRNDGVRLRVAQRLACVELEKVDRFGDVPIRLDPALPDLVDQQRVVFEAAFAQQRGRREHVSRTLLRGRPLPGFEARAAASIASFACCREAELVSPTTSAGLPGLTERIFFCVSILRPSMTSG